MAQLTSILSRPEWWLAVLALALGLGLLAARLRIRWWPAGLLRFGLAALVLLGLFAVRLVPGGTPAPQRQVMLVDQSDSLDLETRRWAWEQAAAWQRAAFRQAPAGLQSTDSEAEDADGGHSRLIVVFGAQAEAVIPRELASADTGQGVPETGTQNILGGDQTLPDQPQVNGRASNLSGALRLGADLMEGAPGSLILLSDGLAEQPVEVDQALDGLTRAGHTLDVIPLSGRSPDGDMAVASLAAPRNLWAGTGFDLLATVYGAQSGARLGLTINGQATSIGAEALAPDLFRFAVPPLAEGSATLEVSALPADPAADPFPENNSGYTVLQVFAPPRVLFVTSRPESAGVARFTQMLGAQGVQVENIRPDGLPTNLNNLDRYQVIFLDNLLASQLNTEQMQALQLFVSRMAGGLVTLGGNNSYTLGGYQDTLLEPMLPVLLEPPPRTQRSPIAFQLVLDRSSSMRIGTTPFSDLTPMNLAREAAMRSIETLRPEDYLGVMTFSDTPFEDVPLRLIGDERGLNTALEAVSQVRAMGTTRMFRAVQEALGNLTSLPADAPENRYMLVLSDGQSTDGSQDQFDLLAEAARDEGIIVSTIALGPAADHELLERVAEAGNGRFYAVEDASQLPRIMLAESQAARSENIQAGETSARVREIGHPILSGVDPQGLPVLDGYNALRSKTEEGAEDVLVSSSFDDPLLSTWQYGLGRVTAWMGDIEPEWQQAAGPADQAQPAGPDASGRDLLWSQIVRYALVDPALNPAQVTVQVTPDHLAVEASIYTLEGEALNLAEVTFTYASPDGATHSYRLAQYSPGGYRAELPLPPEGAYRAVLSYTGSGSVAGEKTDLPAAFAVNAPAEWLPAQPSAGHPQLAAWANAGGGSLISAEDWADAVSTVEQPRAAPDIWWYLLLALVILWPLEIAARRRWLPWI